MKDDSLFDSPEPIFNDDNSSVATKETTINNPDKFEDIGQTTTRVEWTNLQ